MDVKLKPNATYYLKINFSSYTEANYEYAFTIISKDAVKLNKTNVTVKKGQKFTLQLSTKIAAESIDNINWYPDVYDDNVVKTSYDFINCISTDKITVTALKKGKTSITCTCRLVDNAEIYLTCYITVK